MISASTTLVLNGLSVTLAVQLPSESVRQLAGDQRFVFSTEESAEHLAPVVARELPKLLLQAHGVISQSLLVASAGLLKDEATT